MKSTSVEAGDSDIDGDLLLAHRAAGAGDTVQLVRAVQQDPGALEQQDGEGFRPLAHAVQNQQLHAVKRLVKMGADVNAQDSDGRTALSVAAYQGWSDGVVYLLRHGARLSLCDKSGRTALHASTYDNDVRTMISLLQMLSIDGINTPDNEKMTALHWAAFHGRPEHVRHLLLRGADVMSQDVDGKTALHWAAQKGCRACCYIFAGHDKGIELLNSTDNSGKTPIHLASAAGHSQMLLELASFDRNVFELEDQEDRTPLHWAAAMGHADCVNVLLKLGVRSDPLDVDGGTPLQYARQSKQTACVQLLEHKLGLSPSSPHKQTKWGKKGDDKGKNPLGFFKGLFKTKDKHGTKHDSSSKKSGARRISSEKSSKIKVHPGDDIPDKTRAPTSDVSSGSLETYRSSPPNEQRLEKLENDRERTQSKELPKSDNAHAHTISSKADINTVVKPMHLSPLRVSPLPPDIRIDPAAPSSPQLQRRVGELAPLRAVPPAGNLNNQVSGREAGNGPCANEQSSLPTPSYLTFDIIAKKGLPGINQEHQVDADTDKRKKRKKKRRKASNEAYPFHTTTEVENIHERVPSLDLHKDTVNGETKDNALHNVVPEVESIENLHIRETFKSPLSVPSTVSSRTNSPLTMRTTMGTPSISRLPNHTSSTIEVLRTNSSKHGKPHINRVFIDKDGLDDTRTSFVNSKSTVDRKLLDKRISSLLN